MRTTPLARLGATLAREARSLAFTAAVIFVFALFLATIGAGRGPMPFGEFVADFLEGFRASLIVAIVMLLVIEPVRRHGSITGRRRIAALTAAIVVGWALGTVCQASWLIAVEGQPFYPAWEYWWRLSPASLTLGAMLVAVGEFHHQEVRSLEAMRAAETQRRTLEHESLQARVKTLEAQIEPHFLFNSLANVRRLYETDAEAGETMLTRLMRYLEVALPSMRDDRSTLEREAQLIGAYLDLQQVRMGKRLSYGIAIDPALRPVEVPPMMLLTLVENAIKHGLTPRREGGRVDVSATRVGGVLRLDVADTGRGFGSETSGGGTGLANIRARLAAMFGPAAELRLVPGHPHGLIATITIPAPA